MRSVLIAALSLICGCQETVFIGDSITVAWPQIRNVGTIKAVAGETPREMLRRYQKDIDGADVVHILAGTNPDEGAETGDVSSCVENVRVMAEHARSKGAEVLIGIVPPYSLDLFPVRGLYALRFNEALGKMAQENGFKTVDYFSPMVSNGLQRTDLFKDGLHPNEAGYAVMWEALKSAHRF